MKTGEEIVDYAVRQIAYVYHHNPLIYGLTGSGVSIYLHHLHQIWAFATDHEALLVDAYNSQIAAAECGSADFSSKYALDNPNCTQQEIADFVVTNWLIISSQIEIPVPHDEVIRELKGRSGDPHGR